jgi:glycine/D-amino acid oxidase-like deaminating enzyme
VSATAQPQTVTERLEAIEHDLSERERDLYDAAMEWFKKKRDVEHDYAIAYLAATGTVDERKAKARKVIQFDGREEEAKYEAVRAVVRVLETRANIGMALLKAQGRGA